MVVNITDGISDVVKRAISLYKNRLRLGFNGYSQLLCYSFLFSYPSFSYAGPSGHNIVGGTGSINQSGLLTTVNQISSSMAIDWHSFNLSANEIFTADMPDVSSILLNRVIGGTSSEIFGQINANGQVVLVNPNGIFIGSGASLNVGGLIASGLDIDPVDFMNGDYVFKSIDGTSGAVINGGVLNASLGGSISLLGKRVVNEGLISANLGAVNLAAGHEAVLTFDNQGLMGIRVSKEILQDELGVDPAILNNGIITATSGRILLTASQSQDVFSQAVNHDGVTQATSVVVNEDGSFILGAGADVVNNGFIDASSELTATETNNTTLQQDGSYSLKNDISLNEDGSYSLSETSESLNNGVIDTAAASESASSGKVVVLAENFTHSGEIHAGAQTANGGEIELHAKDTLLLTGNSETTARAEENGSGGSIKLLADKVGLFDQSIVDASGNNGGGEVLIGGDYRGLNTQIRNATATYLGENTIINSSAITEGNGGRVIIWGNESTKTHGSISARGGINSGDGGFVETSAKVVDLSANVDVGSTNGVNGTWLIDPYNLTISTTNDDGVPAASPFTAEKNASFLRISTLLTALGNGDVIVETGVPAGVDGQLEPVGGNIYLNDTLDINGIGTSSLTLNAHHDIEINALIRDNNNSGDTLNLTLNANTNEAVPVGGGDVIINARIETEGGTFLATGDNIFLNAAVGFITTGGNNVTMTANTGGAIAINGQIDTSGGNFTAQGATASTGVSLNSGTSSLITTGNGAGNVNIDVTAGVTIQGTVTAGTGTFDANGTTFNGTGSTITANTVDLNGITGAITLGGITASTITANSAASIVQSVADSGLDISGISTFGSSGVITLNDGQNDFGGAVRLTNSGANAVTVTDSNDILLGTSNVGTGTLTVNAVGISQNGVITQTAGAGQATFNGGDGSIILTQNNNFTGNISLNNINTNNVELTNSGAVQLATSNVGSGTLTVNAATAISQSGIITQEANAGATTLNVGAGAIDLNMANDFTGAVSLNNSGPGLVRVADNNDIELGVSNVGSGLFLVSASSGITQSGAITQAAGASTAQFSAGAGEIDLTQANDFTGRVNLFNSGNNAVALTDQDALLLGTVSVGSNTLTVDAVGITQNSVITQAAGAGLATFDANAGQLILGQANNFTGDVSLNNSGANNVAITNTNAIQFATSGIGSGTLTVNATGITQSGAITQEANAGTTTINGGAGAIDLSQSNEFTGSVRLNNSGANAVSITDISNILLGTSNIGTGTLTVDAVGINQDGAITQTAAAGLASFDANAGAINLAQANTFTGDIALFNSGANNVFLNDTGPIQLATSNIGSGTLTVNSTGAITQSGALTQQAAAGATIFNAGANEIALTQANDFTGAVSLNNSLLNNTSITDQNNLQFGASNIGFGTFTVNATGITQNGAIVQEAGAGATVFNGGSGIIDLTQNNDFTGLVSLNNTGGSTSITDQNNITLTTSVLGTGTLTVNAVGIEQSGAITQAANAGNVSFNATTGRAYLGNFSNDFTGSVSLTSTSAVESRILDINGVSLNTINVGTGGIVVAADNGGDITQVGGITSVGNTRFFVDAGQIISLANPANNFQAGISFNALGGGALLDVLITNSGALDLGNINVSRHLGVSAAGNITNSGTLTVGSVAWIEANGNSITLDNTANDFNNIVLNNANSVSITDINGINIGATAADVSTYPGTPLDSNVSGSLNITTLAGDITDINDAASVLSVAGNTTLSAGAGAGNITLDAATNDFSVVNIANATDVTLVDANSIDLLSTVINGNLDVTATTGSILNTTGALNVTGTSDFVAADNNSVLLTNTGNKLNGAISMSSNGPGNLLEATITNSVLTDILSINVTNDLIINSSNGLTQSGLITVGNNTTINTGSQDTVLNLDNNLNTLNIISAGNATVNNGANALLVNGATTSGTVNLSSNGMTIAGAVTGATGANLDSTTGVMQINTDVQTNSGTLEVSGSQVNLNASLISNNSNTRVNSSQGITMAANSDITATNGNILLDAVTNIDLTSLVATSGSATANTTTGSIIDANADSTNILATNVVLHAETGIGQGNAIETVTSSLDVVNSATGSGSGKVEINNTGEVNLIALKNLGSLGDITIENDGSYLINPGSVDSGYDTGALIMRSTGSYLGQGAQPPFTNADITARAGTFFGFAGTFGTTQRPLVLNIRDSALIQTRASLNPQFAEPRPIVNDESLLQFSGLDTLAAISGEQLVEVETLGEVDQAIFTDLQNFSMEEISIRMPRDQLFEDELEEYDRAN